MIDALSSDRADLLKVTGARRSPQSLDGPVIVDRITDVGAGQGFAVAAAGRAGGRVRSSSQFPTGCEVRRGRSSAAWACLRRDRRRSGMERSGAASSAQSQVDVPAGWVMLECEPSAGCVRAGSARLGVREAPDLPMVDLRRVGVALASPSVPTPGASQRREVPFPASALLTRAVLRSSLRRERTTETASRRSGDPLLHRITSAAGGNGRAEVPTTNAADAEAPRRGRDRRRTVQLVDKAGRRTNSPCSIPLTTTTPLPKKG